MFECGICRRKFKLIGNLSYHITAIHNINKQEYYDEYFQKTDDEGFCKVCGKPTKFRNLSYGYNRYCSKTCIGKSGRGRKIIFTTQKNVDLTRKCTFGCGQVARYILKNGKPCCSQSPNFCPDFINRGRVAKIGCKSDKKGRTYVEIYGEDRAKRITSQMQKSRKFTFKDYQKRHPLFCKEEEIREHPKTGELQVHCMNPNCPNSKEKDGWFIPTYTQIYERIRQLENEHGSNGSCFYCSDLCKKSCRFYRKRVSQLIKEDKIRAGHLEVEEFIYTFEEYNTWREEVLKRANYECEYCGEPATHCHHIRPQKLEPFFALDPDWGIATCVECHYKYGHKTGTECSTGKLSSLIC